MKVVGFANPYYINRSATSFGYNENKNYSPEPKPEETLLTAGLLQGVALILHKSSEWCGNKLMQGKEFTSVENVKKVADNMINKNNLPVNADFIDETDIGKYPEKLRKELKPVARGENAFYADELKLAVAPKSKPSLMLHELGHAINAHKGKFLRFLQKSRIYAVSAPTALLMLNEVSPTKNQNQKSFIERNAGLLGFIAFLPTIVEEGLASIRGVNAAKKVLGKSVNLAPLKRNYAFAWMTYVISGIGLGIASKQAILNNKQ